MKYIAPTTFNRRAFRVGDLAMIPAMACRHHERFDSPPMRKASLDLLRCPGTGRSIEVDENLACLSHTSPGSRMK